MSQAKYILILGFLVLSFLVGVPGELLSSDLHLRPVDIANMEGRTTEAEHVPTPCEWRHPLKSVTKRRIDTFALPLVTRILIMHACDQGLGRSCHPSVTVVYQAVPLYQSLQVFRS
jgi:hypothetical protein